MLMFPQLTFLTGLEKDSVTRHCLNFIMPATELDFGFDDCVKTISLTV